MNTKLPLSVCPPPKSRVAGAAGRGPGPGGRRRGEAGGRAACPLPALGPRGRRKGLLSCTSSGWGPRSGQASPWDAWRFRAPLLRTRLHVCERDRAVPEGGRGPPEKTCYQTVVTGAGAGFGLSCIFWFRTRRRRLKTTAIESVTKADGPFRLIGNNKLKRNL